MKSKTYLYLGRRDKSSIQILASFPGSTHEPVRVNNIKDLNLPIDLETAIADDVHKNKMSCELWAEGAEDYTQLRKSMLARGYKNVPGFHTPKHFSEVRNCVKSINPILPPPVKTMMNRKSLNSSNKSFVNKKTTRINLD